MSGRPPLALLAVVLLAACGGSPDPRETEPPPAVTTPDGAPQPDAPSQPDPPPDQDEPSQPEQPSGPDEPPQPAPDVAPQPEVLPAPEGVSSALDIPAEIALQDEYLRASRAVEQVSRLEALIARDPNQAAAHYLHGRLLGNLKQLPQAKASFDRALTLDPGLAWAHHGVGIYYDKTGDRAAAIVALERAHTLAPEQAQFALDLAVEYFHIGPPRRPDALALVARAIALAPKRGDLHVFHGEMLDADGKGELARDAYRRAIDTDPRCYVAYAKLAAALLHAGDVAGAIRTYRELVPVLESPVERGNARRRVDHLERLLASKQLETMEGATTSAELTKQFTSDDPVVRRRAYQRLSEWGRASDLPQLYLGLIDEDVVVRVTCVNGIARTGRPETVPWLVKVLRLDVSVEVRVQAAQRLADVGTRALVPDLVALLSDEDDGHVLQRMAATLCRLSGDTVAEKIDRDDVVGSRAKVASAWEQWWTVNREAGDK